MGTKPERWGICCNTIADGYLAMDAITRNLPIKSRRSSSYDYFVELEDGTIIQLILGRSEFHGWRADVLYIEENIDEQSVRACLAPMLIGRKLIRWFRIAEQNPPTIEIIRKER